MLVREPRVGAGCIDYRQSLSESLEGARTALDSGADTVQGFTQLGIAWETLFDLAVGVHDGGVVVALKRLSDFEPRFAREFACGVDGNLSDGYNITAPTFTDQLSEADSELLADSCEDGLEVDLAWGHLY